MASTKIAVEQRNITVHIGDHSVDLTLDELQRLYDAIGGIAGIKKPGGDINPWGPFRQPTQPWVQPPVIGDIQPNTSRPRITYGEHTAPPRPRIKIWCNSGEADSHS